MAKKKVMLWTNPPWCSSGLGENGKHLAQHLAKTGKYDLIYYNSFGSMVNDPKHKQVPWKSIGCLPNDQNFLNQLQQDQGRFRYFTYGNGMIDTVINENKPDILWMSDDAWSFPDIHRKQWFTKLNPVYHVTVDSKPVLPLACDQARSCKNFYTWAKFAAEEMKSYGPEYSHVKYIYGMSDINNFSPIPKINKSELRKEFGISDKTVVIGYLGRNQLRKEFLNFLVSFNEFKKENPYADVKIHFHTSASEHQAGWDFSRVMDYYKMDRKNVLFTHICKACKRWEVKPYDGEDKNCRYCKTEKSVITPNIGDSVPDEEMKFLYGLWDASVSPITSGGLEYHNVQSLLCGLPLASTNYSSGEDFAELPFVYPINWHLRFEAQTSFIKATNDISSMKNFIAKMHKLSSQEREEIGFKGREWAVKNFDHEKIGKQWEEIFDNLPSVNPELITLDSPRKNESYPMPLINDNLAWIKDLYKNILLMEMPDNDNGVAFWLESLKNGKSRSDVYTYFLSVARDENNKNQKKQDFSSIIDKNGKKRALFLIKESIGDIILCTQLFESFKDTYSDTDLYVATSPQFFEILDGNPYIYKVIAYAPWMENEMAVIGAGQNKGDGLFDFYFHPGIPTQRILNYLSADKINFDINR